MEQTTKDLPGLINAVTSELSWLRYSPVTISKCNAVWQKLLSYTQAKDLLHFSENLCESFLLEYYYINTQQSVLINFRTEQELLFVLSECLEITNYMVLFCEKEKSSNHRARMGLLMQYGGLFCIHINAEIQ